MDEEKVFTHPSYALVSFSRVSGTTHFFGSSVRSNSYIVLRVRRAEHKRSLSSDWYHGRDLLLELRLSPNQFSELITSMNIGEGVPATLQHIGNYERIPDPPFENREEVFKEEISEHGERIAKSVEDHQLLIEGLNIPKKVKEQLLASSRRINMEVQSNLPFVMKMAYKSLSKSVQEAKATVECFITHTLTRLGLKKAQEDPVSLMLEEKKEEVK